mmetsp:Transcript_26362/g.39522  ORF Transcript_26362/g.39522 Transcript_26362/m.39522 type:complete len:99 (-) Transcript_26362:266-562(-)
MLKTRRNQNRPLTKKEVMYKFDGNSIKQNEISFPCELPSSSGTTPTFVDKVVIKNTCTLKNENDFPIEEEKEEEKHEVDSIRPAFHNGKHMNCKEEDC